MTDDIRWEQRFHNFNKAFLQLEKFIGRKQLNELEEQGLIKSFEYTYELAWKTLQDYLKHTGVTDVIGPKPVIQQSFQSGYIRDGEGWMRMIEARNLTSHTYNEEVAARISSGIKDEYYQLFKDLNITLDRFRVDN